MEEIHKKAVMSECACLLRHWKERCTKYVNKHVKANKPGPPPKFRDVDDEADWNKFLQHINDPAFIVNFLF